MRSVVVVSGVLGVGTALVFALAALAATMFPNGTMISNGWNGGCFDCGGWEGKPGVAVPIPMPMPIEPVPEKGLVLPGRPGLVVIDVAGAGVAEPASTDGDVLPER